MYATETTPLNTAGYPDVPFCGPGLVSTPYFSQVSGRNSLYRNYLGKTADTFSENYGLELLLRKTF